MMQKLHCIDVENKKYHEIKFSCLNCFKFESEYRSQYIAFVQ